MDFYICDCCNMCHLYISSYFYTNFNLFLALSSIMTIILERIIAPITTGSFVPPTNYFTVSSITQTLLIKRVVASRPTNFRAGITSLELALPSTQTFLSTRVITACATLLIPFSTLERRGCGHITLPRITRVTRRKLVSAAYSHQTISWDDSLLRTGWALLIKGIVTPTVMTHQLTSGTLSITE